jgi:tRNA nucleotidyltransferase (CCA-adding enzyme)
MADYGVLPSLSPSVKYDGRMEELFSRLREVISWYRLSFLDEPLEKWRVYLLGLFSGLTPSELAETCARLQFSPTEEERLRWTYEKARELFRSFLQLSEMPPSGIYRTLQPFRPEELLYVMAKAQPEEFRRAISHYFHRYRHVRTELRGRDLKAMGIPPGPIYRRLLDELLDARLNGQVKNRQEEIFYVKWRYHELFGLEATEGDAAAAGSPS